MSTTFIVSASYDKDIRFWDGATGRTVRSFPFQGSQVNAMLVIPDTARLAVGGFGTLRIYDIGADGVSAGSSGANQAPPLFSVYENQYAMNVTSLGTFPLYPHRDEELHVNSAEVSLSSLVYTASDLGATGTLDATAVMMDSAEVLTVLFATSEDGHIRFFNANSPTTLSPLLDISAGAAITCSAVSPDRHTLFTGSQIGRVSVWHIPSIVATASLQGDKSGRAVPFANKPMQEIAFNGDYTAIRSIAVEPLARWAVAATSAGKLHFMCFARCAQSLTGVQMTDPTTTGQMADEEGPGEEGDTGQQAQRSANGGVAAENTATGATDDCSSRSVHSATTLRPSCGSLPHLKTQRCEGSGDIGATARESPLLNDGASFSATNEASDVLNLASSADVGRKSGTHAFLSSSSVNLTSIQNQFFVKVFHSFQAHHKYILKVAISPNMDMLVTCCGDYTVGRFLIPPSFQCCEMTRHTSRHETDAPSAGAGLLTTTSLKEATSVEKGATAACDTTGHAPAMAESGTVGTGCLVAASSSSLLQPRAESSDALTSVNALPRSSTNSASGSNVEDDVRAGSTAGKEPSASETQPPTGAGAGKGVTGATGATTNKQPEGAHLSMSNFPPSSIEGSSQVDVGNTVEFKELRPLTGHTRWVWDCVFSDCGRFLFTASSDQTLRMWTSLLSDRPQSTSFVGHTKPVVCCILYVEKRRNQ